MAKWPDSCNQTMSLIIQLRKFLADNERFVVLKGDYVGHPFHGNQYTQMSVENHLLNGAGAVRNVASLKSEGRRRYGRSHGYSLDGEMAQQALDALDHLASAREKLPEALTRAKINADTIEWQQRAGTTKTPSQYYDEFRWHRSGLSPQKTKIIDDAYELMKREQQLRNVHVTQPSGNLSRWGSRNINPTEMTKVAVSALNRGYKELTGTSKSLIDKNNQPRVEPMKVVLADVKGILTQTDNDTKLLADENADPVERANALTRIARSNEKSASAANFVAQVYRISGDMRNYAKWSKLAETYKNNSSGGGLSGEAKSNIYLNAYKQLREQTNAAGLEKINPATITPDDLKKLEDLPLRQAYTFADNASNAMSASQRSDADRNEIALAQFDSLNAIRLRDAITKTCGVYEAQKAVNDALAELRNTTEHGIKTIDEYGQKQVVSPQYDAAKTASNRIGSYRNALSDAQQAWKKIQDNMTFRKLDNGLYRESTITNGEAIKDKAQSQLGILANQNEIFGRNANSEVGRAFIATSKELIAHVSEHLNPSSPEEAKDTKRILDLAESSADIAIDRLNEKQGTSYAAPRIIIPGLEKEYAEAEDLKKMAIGYGNLVHANAYAAIGEQMAHNLPPVDTKDTQQLDSNSYMSKYYETLLNLRNASDYYQRTTSDNESRTPTAETKSVIDLATKRKGEVDALTTRITTNHNNHVVSSSLSNLRDFYKDAKDPNSENPRKSWNSAKAQLNILQRVIQNAQSDQYKSVQQEIEPIAQEIQSMDNRFRREAYYDL
jgi:hypothetical protein